MEEQKLMMRAKDFYECPDVVEIMDQLRSENIRDKVFSDLIDDDGNQYVDLVLEGGGVLGIALLGFTYALEQMGIRFFSIAGTSAGAITALLLAAYEGVGAEKTPYVLEKLANKDLYELVDAPPRVKKLIEAAFENKGLLRLIIMFLRVRKYVMTRLGMSPGHEFHDWVAEILEEQGVSTSAALEARMDVPSNLKIREERKEGRNRKLKARVVIITTELTTETRVIFPEMNHLFWERPDAVHPAEYVRASMSVPIFFQPLKISLYDPKSPELKAIWQKEVDYRGELPEEAVFVDGGIVSNFPIDVFHSASAIPRFPTFGVKLGDDRNQINGVNSISSLMTSMFNAASHVLDYQFLWRHPDYSKLISKINTGDVNWLNFAISREEKLLLFTNGVKAAAEFLRGYDWDAYKNFRAEQLGKSLD